MPHTNAAELRTAARAVTTSFLAIPSASIPLGPNLDPQALEEVARRYAAYGYAVVTMSGEPTIERHTALSEALDLGEPFVPPLYQRGGIRPGAVSTISAAANATTSEAGHPSFGQTVGQELHCDGTLQPIGHLGATLMTCQAVAQAGGDSTLFNSVAAYADLIERDLEAALALAHPETLMRQANINGCEDTNIGPAFAVQSGQLVGYYCVTETDSWLFDRHPDPDALHRAVDFLARAAARPSPYFRTETLNAGEALILDNTRVSHGRTAYVDSPDDRRCIFRTLHLSHPRVHSDRRSELAEARASSD